MVKIVDLYSESEEVQFGTCELCFSTGICTFESIVFEDENGKQEYYELGAWSWGDYYQPYEIENIVDFAHFWNKFNIKRLEDAVKYFGEIYDRYDCPECYKDMSRKEFYNVYEE